MFSGGMTKALVKELSERCWSGAESWEEEVKGVEEVEPEEI
jgi:hypothetical protein